MGAKRERGGPLPGSRAVTGSGAVTAGCAVTGSYSETGNYGVTGNYAVSGRCALTDSCAVTGSIAVTGRGAMTASCAETGSFTVRDLQLCSAERCRSRYLHWSTLGLESGLGLGWGPGCLNIENNPRWVISPPGPTLLC